MHADLSLWPENGLLVGRYSRPSTCQRQGTGGGKTSRVGVWLLGRGYMIVQDMNPPHALAKDEVYPSATVI
eukprot:354852-Chlamydomonas_euryale.AAC.4